MASKGKSLAAVVLVCLLQAGLLVWQAWNTGVTVDEPAHVVSSYLYWQGRDFLLPRDMPPLIKIASGWSTPDSLMTSIVRPSKRSSTWEWDTGLHLMSVLRPADLDRLFFWGRLPFLVFPLATTVLVFVWGRALFGPAAGLIAAVLFAFEPTSLGHGALIKNDHAAAFCYLLFWYAAWRYWNAPAMRNLLLLIGSTALAIQAKNSLGIVVMLAPVLILLRGCYPWRCPAWRTFLHAMLPVLAAYILALATSWFDLDPLTYREYVRLLEDSTLPHGFLFDTVLYVASYVPTPRLFFDGVISLLRSNANGNAVYLLGSVHPQGSLWYFLVALAVKVPHSLQFLVVGGIAAITGAVARRRMPAAKLCFLLIPPVLYVGIGSLSSLQLGIRLILPALPFGVLLAAYCWRCWEGAGVRWGVVALVGTCIVETGSQYPHLIGYFNRAAAGRQATNPYLLNSNMDWGQDLPALADYVRGNIREPIHLSYFGSDNPARYFDDRVVRKLAPPWSAQWAQGNRYEPKPGYYAISVNLLPGHFFQPEYRDYYEAFRRMQPIYRAGSSILVYHLKR